jgi:hypothetical protein
VEQTAYGVFSDLVAVARFAPGLTPAL